MYVNLCFSQSYLSNLTATKNDPLFTTYAAPLQRSEFIVDEGYHFRFYANSSGIDFITDNAGYLSLAFKLDGAIKYYLPQMHSEPLITTSYSDLVKYCFEPFEGIDVQIFFQVYSSRMAIQNIKVKNNRGQPVQLDLYPFLRHPVQIESVSISAEQRGFSFTHREDPDGWTLGHGVPYRALLTNLYLLSEQPDAFGSYHELGSLPPPETLAIATLENYCVEWGPVRHADSSLCLHTPPQAQQILFHNASTSEMLTEDAPKWGDPDPNIPGNGYQGCELGNFRNPPIASGDSFTVIFTCQATNQQGTAHGIIPALPAPTGVYTEIMLSTDPFPQTPQNVNIDFSANFTSAVISWAYTPGLLYSLYRRTYSTPGRYDLLADSISSPAYMDLGLNPDSSYGYVVIARDSAGRFSGHSLEVGNISVQPLFSDMAHNFLYNGLTPAQTRIVAFQKRFDLIPAQSDSIRIIRGVAESTGDPDSLRSECENLLVYEMQQAVLEDENLYSQIPLLNFPSADFEMMYWSAFSMMRQCFLPPEGECSYNYNVYSREPTWGWGHAGQVFHENLSMLAYAFMDPVSAQASQWVFAERMNAQPVWPAGYIPYRVGPYLNEVNYLAGEHSSSAPWFSWENLEIFKVGGDTTFLEQMYNFGQDFYNFWINQRDDDNDGLCEWGGHAFWESVRDYNVIWHILGGWSNPHNANKVEALDLNCELVMEAKSLAEMAMILGRPQEAQQWLQRAQERADSINAIMWDPVTNFYYHVEKYSHSFTYQDPDDLKHKEHIGFQTIWAGIANQNQLNYLLAELHDPNTFGRPYGSPLMDYSDPLDPSGTNFFHHAMYPEWDFQTFQGLIKHYGLISEADYIAQRIFSGVVKTLKSHHNFYESYHVDTGEPYGLHTYIWTGVVARMMIDLYGPPSNLKDINTLEQIDNFRLSQNYPNPFNQQTIFYVTLPESQEISFVIYDILGREIKTLMENHLTAGRYKIRWDGKNYSCKNVASGVYFARLKSKDKLKVRKILLVR